MVLELTVETYLVNCVGARGGIAVKMNIRGRVGWPDRLCPMPEGVTIYAELKRPIGGRVSKTQKHVHDQLRAMGHVVAVLSSRAEIDEFFRRYDAGEV